MEENKQVFDVMTLLRDEKLDTKPNFAKFLEAYVRDVRVCVGSKIQFYPTLKYDTRKIFVTFLDGHELVMFVQLDFPTQDKYYLEYNFDTIELKPKERELVEGFFQKLIEFKFVKIM